MLHSRVVPVVVLLIVLLAGTALNASEQAAPDDDCAGWVSADSNVQREFFWGLTPESVLVCVEAGADPNARTAGERTPLHWAAEGNENSAVIATLLEAGADPNARDEDEETPLHWAARWNENSVVIATLLKVGADPNARDEDERTPLHRAARWNVNLR